MAASKDKASALKDSYVDGIIAELGGQSDPAVRMAMRENDVASIHSFPMSGKVGAINDGDPTVYIHSDDKTYPAGTREDFGNPIPNQGPGGRQLLDSNQEMDEKGIRFINEMEGRMGGTGDLARLGPRTMEEFNKRRPENRTPEQRKLRGNRSSGGAFDASNLAGAMGMEQGNTAGVVIDVKNNVVLRKNDHNPRMVLRDGNRMNVMNLGAGAGMPIKNAPYGASEAYPVSQRGQMGAALYEVRNQIDTLPQSVNSADDASRLYNAAMYQPYTR